MSDWILAETITFCPSPVESASGVRFSLFCPHSRRRPSHSSHGLSISATIVAVPEGEQEIGPLKQTFSIAFRMAIVLAFLLGLPLVAVPQISEQLQGLLTAQREFRPPVSAANPPPSVTRPHQSDDKSVLVERGTTVTMLASDRSQPPLIQPNPEGLTATIEALKAQFVEAGVSYMVLEQIGTDSAEYRFRFDLPVAAGSAYRKRFQVVDHAPDEAMRQALTELQRWRVAGREPAHLERPTVILR